MAKKKKKKHLKNLQKSKQVKTVQKFMFSCYVYNDSVSNFLFSYSTQSKACVGGQIINMKNVSFKCYYYMLHLSIDLMKNIVPSLQRCVHTHFHNALIFN